MGFGDILQGATGGALGGSALGPVGAVGGGILGALGGYLGGGGDDDARRKYLGQVDSRTAPQSQYTTSAYSGFRGNQADLIRQLEAQARGEGPSLSREMLNAGLDRSAKQQQSMVAGGRGNPALMGMVAANNMGQASAQANQDAALARVQEQKAALEQLGLSLYGARGADEETNRFNAQQFNMNSANNADNRLRLMALNDQAHAGMAGNTPSVGSQILAGGAGLRSWYDAQQANNRPQG